MIGFESSNKLTRREVMQKIPSKGTSIEMLFRKSLWARGIRYRVNGRMKGKPDIYFCGIKLAIFIDSCFWHGCVAHCRMPSSNTDYWRKKILGNVERDKLTSMYLESNGWKVLRIWEHDMKTDLNQVIDNVCKVIEFRMRIMNEAKHSRK